MLSNEQREFYFENGYLIVEGLLSGEKASKGSEWRWKNAMFSKVIKPVLKRERAILPAAFGGSLIYSAKGRFGRR